MCKSILVLVYHWNYVGISYRFSDIQRQRIAWPWNRGLLTTGGQAGTVLGRVRQWIGWSVRPSHKMVRFILSTDQMSKSSGPVWVLCLAVQIFTARRVCIARTMPWQDACLSVCLSLAGILSKRLYVSSKFFSPSASPTIVVFQYQTGWQYSDGTP